MFDILRSVRPQNTNSAALINTGVDAIGSALDTYNQRVRATAENRALTELMGTSRTGEDGKELSGMGYRDALFGASTNIEDLNAKTAMEAIGLMSNPVIKQGNEDRNYGLDERRVGIAGGHLGVAKSRLLETNRHNKIMEDKPTAASQKNWDTYTNEDGKVFMYDKRDPKGTLIPKKDANPSEAVMPGYGASVDQGMMGGSDMPVYAQMDPEAEVSVSPWEYNPTSKKQEFTPTEYDKSVTTKLSQAKEFDSNTTRDLSKYRTDLFKWAGNNKKKQLMAKDAYSNAEKQRKFERTQYDMSPGDTASIERVDALNAIEYNSRNKTEEPALVQKDKVFIDNFGTVDPAMNRVDSSITANQNIFGPVDAWIDRKTNDKDFFNLSGVGQLLGTESSKKAAQFDSDTSKMMSKVIKSLGANPSDRDLRLLEAQVPLRSDEPETAMKKLDTFKELYYQTQANTFNRIAKSNPTSMSRIIDRANREGKSPVPGYDLVKYSDGSVGLEPVRN